MKVSSLFSAAHLFLKKFLPLIVLFITVVSCEKEANIKMPSVSEKLVINSFISPQDTVLRVHVGKTTPVFGTKPQDYEHSWRVSIKGAVVSISDGSRKIQLSYDSAFGDYISSKNELQILAGKQYFIEVEAIGQKVTSSCIIPEATQISSIEVDSSKERTWSGERMVEVSVHWKDILAWKNYYRLSGEREFKDGTDYSGPLFDHMGFENDLIIDIDGGTGDFSRKSKVYPDSGYRPNSKTKKFHIYLLTVDKNYYTYHKWYRTYEEDNPFVEPTLVPTNIEGGLGVFAGYNKSHFVYEVK